MFNERTRYTLKMFAYLAVDRSNEYQTIDQLAGDLEIPRGYLGKICQELAHSGYLDSKKGVNGGVRLNKEPSDIIVADLLEELGVLTHRTEDTYEACCVPKLFDNCMIDLWMDRFREQVIGSQDFAELVEELGTSQFR